VHQVIVEPTLTATLAGPVVPLYCVVPVLIIMMSKDASVKNPTTPKVPAAWMVIVQVCDASPYVVPYPAEETKLPVNGQSVWLLVANAKGVATEEP
jgi:hypothetical protein